METLLEQTPRPSVGNDTMPPPDPDDDYDDDEAEEDEEDEDQHEEPTVIREPDEYPRLSLYGCRTIPSSVISEYIASSNRPPKPQDYANSSLIATRVFARRQGAREPDDSIRA